MEELFDKKEIESIEQIYFASQLLKSCLLWKRDRVCAKKKEKIKIGNQSNLL